MAQKPDINLVCHQPTVLVSGDKKFVVIASQQVENDKDGRPALSGKTIHLKMTAHAAGLLLQQLETLRPFYNWATDASQLKVEFSPPDSEKH